ncbi:BrnT family toxin, partial [Aliivibrio fischeri]
MVNFEFDEVKSNSNLEKHGVDFNVAQLLWNDPDLIEIPVNTHDEPRYIVIA